jgi:nitroreductase
MATVDPLTDTDFESVVRARRSVRGFLDKRVPDETLKAIFELAQWAPSNCNIQPWLAYVASGALRDRMREQFVKCIMDGVPPNPDYDYPGKFEGEYRTRQVECAVAMYTEMGIARDDSGGRMRAMLRNFELFDAPHVAFIGMHKDFGTTVAIDVGMYVQTLMLAMTAHGIGSCAQGSMRYYPDLVREAFNLNDDIHILCGISFGYEDPDVPANRTRTTRAELSENVTFRE